MIRLNVLLVSLLIYNILPGGGRDDFYAWTKRHKFVKDANFISFLKLMNKFPEFRTLIYYRLPRFIRIICRFICPSMKCLYIHTKEIGGGMIIEHGYNTIIVANRIGENFFVHQNVTIGYNHKGKPIIGDNVKVYTGAVVAGGIKIGNNVTIGANCVVLKDVPSDSWCYGNPCIIKNKG